MKKQFVIYIVLTALMCSCGKVVPPEIAPTAELPQIYPDYIGVTIPDGIAPMDFNVLADSVDYVYVIARGAQGGEIVGSGSWARFDIDEWHDLTSQNRDASITFDVYVRNSEGLWSRFQPFEMYVSAYPLVDYGVTYRRINPGFETYSKIGIYQRDLSSFDEFPILEETAVNGQCINCHYSNRGNPDQMSIHVRGATGGTLLRVNDELDYLNTKTAETIGSCTYGYWHPAGEFCAYSLNKVYQNFYMSKDKMIEPWDLMSDIVVLDVNSRQLITSPLLTNEDYQTTPAFSADGTTLYFCQAPKQNMPAHYDRVRYNLCSIPFDADKGAFVDTVMTVISADSIHKSVTQPRPSYDGRFIVYCLSEYGTTPINHEDADLWIVNLNSGEHRCMDELNSDETDAYHNWSSDSHWMVFGSKREDRMTSLLYFANVDSAGLASKPFLMPQRNPKKYYMDNLQSFNVPDFTSRKVKIDPLRVQDLVSTSPRHGVSMRK